MKRQAWLPLMLILGMLLGVLLLFLLRPTNFPATEVTGASTLTLPPAPANVDVDTDSESPVAALPTASTAEDDSAPSNEPTPTRAIGTPNPAQTPLILAGYFVTVESGDTLWSIAIDANVLMEDIIEANPEIEPDLLLPGDRLLIPDPVSPFLEVAPGTGATPELSAVVDTGGEALNLRSSPAEGQNIVTALAAGSSLNVVGRTVDNLWLQVITAAGGRGWVMAEFVALPGDLDDIPVTQGGATPVPAVAEAPAEPAATAPPAVLATRTPLSLYPDGVPVGSLGQPGDYPYVTNITDSARAIFERGQQLGNRPDVFSKVGDSITVAAAFLTPIGREEYDLRDYTYLGPVIDYYSATIARTENSYANISLTAKGGWSAWTVLNPGAANPNSCLPDESPLVCEYRLVRPSVALVMLGTNDVTETSFDNYEEWMRQTIEISIDMGVIPVLSTIPEFHRPNVAGRVGNINAIIVQLAYEYGVPLWDYHAALVGLPDDGLSSDGVHPSWVPDPPATTFTPDALQYGMTVRNLTALQTLDAIWRQVIRPQI